MTIARFYLKDIAPPWGRVTLEKEEHHYASRVLRLRTGQEVMLLDGRGTVCRASVVAIDPQHTFVEIKESRREEEERPRLLLYQALLKDAGMGEVLRRNVELGIARVLPFVSHRSLAAFDERRQERWNRIAREASRVAGRAYLPHVEKPLSWEDLLSSLSRREKVLYADEKGGERPSGALAAAVPEEIAMVIGPEGGFTDGERAALREAGAVPVTLGPYNLRAESAGAVLASAVRAHLGLL